MLCIGPGKLKSKPKWERMSVSSSMSYSLRTYFLSSSGNKLIILLKLGEIGYSSLAAMRTLMTDKCKTLCRLKYFAPIMAT